MVCCCCALEVKYRKRGGGFKVLNDRAILISDIDLYLNKIMQKSNFSAFLSVKMFDIHARALQSADSDNSDDSDEDTDEIDVGMTRSPHLLADGVEQ